MSKNQNMISKKAFAIWAFWILLSPAVFAQTAQELINQGDSLFSMGKFTESFEQYEKLDQEYLQSSPSMLLKMAYIKEGLGDMASTLYYLNRYALETRDRSTFEYMESTAKKSELSGYAFGDLELVMSFVYSFQQEVALLMLLVGTLILLWMVVKKRKNPEQPLHIEGIALTLLLACIFYWVNYMQVSQRGIIFQNHTYLMAAPSAAADVVEIVPKGHRLKIKGKKDIWYKVEWKDQVVYLKENQVRLIP
jgi:uncharacterized membrane protein (UPF0136 family)